jgi:hypothetical protein
VQRSQRKHCLYGCLQSKPGECASYPSRHLMTAAFLTTGSKPRTEAQRQSAHTRQVWVGAWSAEVDILRKKYQLEEKHVSSGLQVRPTFRGLSEC